MARFMALFNEEQAITLSELELLRKIHSLQHMDNLFKDHIFVIVNFDAGGWNNLFRMAVCEPVLRQVHEAVMGTEAFSKSQYPFRATLFYIADQDIFIQWDGQDGGVEGHLQLDWMEVYYGQIQAAFRGLPVVVRILVKGDDLRAIIGIPQYIKDDPQSSRMNLEDFWATDGTEIDIFYSTMSLK
ncbi:hypothetical protein LAZ67_4001958 [Cordylochernes scorpioides]|uniref:RdRp catalytic domain-containing protein n=1 Tax=Cordylochernes scorpioides TaxID=51811 RepID=A0ABY6KCE8_9ARAC|nr:hypothetical protein LAZ67_4001958 [Cordylochernes scorpioides]